MIAEEEALNNPRTCKLEAKVEEAPLVNPENSEVEEANIALAFKF